MSAERLAEVERKRLKTSGNFRNHERRRFKFSKSFEFCGSWLILI